jgi:hypothetical protein
MVNTVYSNTKKQTARLLYGICRVSSLDRLRERNVCGMVFCLCDSDILLIILRNPLMSCVLRLFRLGLEDDWERYKAVTVQRLWAAGLTLCAVLKQMGH